MSLGVAVIALTPQALGGDQGLNRFEELNHFGFRDSVARPANLDQVNQVQPTLGGFHSSNEVLFTPERRCQLPLGQPCRLPHRHDSGGEEVRGGVVHAFDHVWTWSRHSGFDRKTRSY